MPGLRDRSRRPRTNPNRVSSDVEALICELRREHPRWGARRISYELGLRGLDSGPARATVHRILTRNGLIDPQGQQHKRKYKRWQRQTPMHLWQLDIVGGVPLADGRECKLVTGLDDHSRFVVIAAIVVIANGRAVCEAFTAAMPRYGVPSEVLSDNGKQFTGRHHRPQPVEVLFETICRHNGITQRLTKPRSPTTTGKIERFHKTLRAESLDHVAPFESLDAAQAAVEGWIEGYNHQRPHQSLDMATPASLFRPNGPTRIDSLQPVQAEPEDLAPLVVDVIEPSAQAPSPAAVEFELRVPPSGETSIVSGKQTISLHRSLAGRTVTIWADLRSIHITMDGNLLRTVSSRLAPEDLATLTMRGARPAGLSLAEARLPAPSRQRSRTLLAW
jgi:transposase InsO family protein